MPCHVRSSSVSRRRRTLSPSGLLFGHPKPAALLDLSQPGERYVERFMRWAATGPRPMWSPLAVARREKVLLVAVAWREWPHDEPFGLVEISLAGDGMRWQTFPLDQKQRMMAMVSDGKPAADLALTFGEVLRHHREQAGLSRWEVAALAKLSWGTVRNVETGRTAPHPWTVRCLRAVEALRLVEPLALLEVAP
jgi:DNA-binding transcriptional regulator YiaG